MGDAPLSEAFSIRVVRDGRAASIVLSGEIDLATEGALADALAEALAEPGVERLAVDLRGVTFIDSCGLSGAVVRPARAAEDAGIDFHVTPGPGVTKALQISGLDRFVSTGE